MLVFNVRIVMKYIVLLMLFFSFSTVAQQAAVEEIIVMGVRAELDVEPGIVLQKKADFVLVELELLNDSRDESVRARELHNTIKNALKQSKKSEHIQLSYVENDIVIPITDSNYKIDLLEGRRPDTNVAWIRVKTNLTNSSLDVIDLITKIKAFSSTIKLEGRTEINISRDVDISVVNINQYRKQLIDLIAQDISYVTGALGDEYKVVLSGLDKPIQSFRSGSSSLSLFIPYTYQIVPENIHSIFNFPDY